MEWGSNSDETRLWSFAGKKLNVFRTGMAWCVFESEWFHFESLWAHVLANEAGSQRPGTQNLDVTWWLNRLDPPQKSMHPPFSDKCHPTIFSSPRSFAVFSFLRPSYFPRKVWKFHFFCQVFGFRGPRQGPGKGRRSSRPPSGRGASADSLGASGGPWGWWWPWPGWWMRFSSNFIWIV